MIKVDQVPPASFPSSPSDPEALAAKDLWAKFQKKLHDGLEESIPYHTANALAVALHLKEHYQPLIKESEEFWRDLFIALLFHDSGKFVLNFQRENRKGAVGKGRNWAKYIRHEFISCVLLVDKYQELCAERPYALMAVAGHHKPLTHDLYEKDAGKQLEFNEADLTSISGWLASRLEPLGISWTFDGPASRRLADANTPGNSLADLRRYLLNRRMFLGTPKQPAAIDYFQEDSTVRRLRYARFMGLVHAADWGGSGRRFPSAPLEYSERDLFRKMREQIGKGFESWHAFQAESRLPGNVLTIAPTGSGKTEAALLWASERPPGSKVIYCLPTKVTSNAIYKRIKGMLPDAQAGEAYVGVVHSGAKNYRILDDADYVDWDYLQDKVFDRDVVVCTVDQLLTIGFNLGHWHLRTLHLSGASIVIDEIHLYQPYSLGLIIRTIQYLRQYCDARFYIMTATLPAKLKRLLEETLAEFTAVEDKNNADQCRNVWKYVDANLADPDLDKAIRKDITADKKVLIIRNTVDDCITTYETYRELSAKEKRCCLHSRFTQKDRLAKEKIVTNLNKDQPFLLVSTQVVEVSLDIDFDVLYTENAPIDALVQRAGRVNRKGKKKHTEVIVFNACENSKSMYEEEVPDVIKRTRKELLPRSGTRIREDEMVELVNGVYEHFEVTETEAYRRGLNAYTVQQKSRDYILDTEFGNEEDSVYTREGIDSVSVIPLCFKPVLETESIATKSQYQIPISRKQFARLPVREIDEVHEYLIYVDSTYSTETGLYIPSWKEINDPKTNTQTC